MENAAATPILCNIAYLGDSQAPYHDLAIHLRRLVKHLFLDSATRKDLSRTNPSLDAIRIGDEIQVSQCQVSQLCEIHRDGAHPASILCFCYHNLHCDA